MRPSLIPSLLLVILTALAFWPARTATFILYDDPQHVTQNPYILPPSAARLAYFWRFPFDKTPVDGITTAAGAPLPPYQEIYSPLAFTTWGLLVYPARIASAPTQDDPLTRSVQHDFSLDPSIYHSFNIGLHVLNVLLMFALLRLFVKQEWAGALGAALFGLHPVQVEPVAWVTGMNNLLSGFFALAALLLYLKNKDESETPRWRVGAYWGSTFCFLLSVLSKPSSVTLSVLALLLCWGLGEKRWRSRLLEMIPWAVITLFCIVSNAIVQKGIYAGVRPSMWQRPFLIGDALTFYGSKLLFPWNLAPDYGRRPVWVMAQPLTYFLWLVPVGICLFVWLCWRRSSRQNPENRVPRIALLALAIFGLVLLPTSGIVTYYFHSISTVADRYMYMALMGPAILVAVVASRCAELPNLSLRRPLAALSFGLVFTSTILSFQQTKLWQSNFALWPHNIAVNPQTTIAYIAYGNALYDDEQYPKAIQVMEQGARVDPNNWQMELALGNAYYKAKNYGASEAHYRRCLQLYPNLVGAHFGLGILYSQLNKVPEAIDQFSQGLRLQPGNPLLLGFAGVNLTKAGKAEEGAVYIREALKQGLEPSKGHLYLGNALARQGQINQAMQEWTSSMQYDPKNYEPYYNLGITVARMGNTALATQFFERTAQLKPDFAPAQVQLGLLWQKQGETVKAKAAFREALRLDPSNALVQRALQAFK